MFQTIRFRLTLIAAVPLLFALLLVGSSLKTAYTDLSQMSDLDRLVQLASHVSAHVHESQKERGATGVFMGSGGTKFGNELAEQRKTTDTRRAALKEFLTSFDASTYGKEFEQDLATAVEKMESIDEYRTKVSSLSIPAKEALGFYTSHNAAMLDLVANTSKLSDDAELAKVAAAYGNFLQGKERAGIERAVMSKTFGADRFEAGVLRKFGYLVTAQDTYFASFRELASPEQVTFYDENLSGDVVNEVQRMRDIAFKKGEVQTDGFGIEASHWFDTITKKINLMKEVDDRLASDLQATSQRKVGSLVTLLTLSTDISSLVHEIQKERGLTAAYYGSGREKFVTELENQRKQTDAKKHLFEKRVEQLDRTNLDETFVSVLRQAEKKLSSLESHRSNVSNDSIKAGDAIGYYTKHNSLMLNAISATIGSTDDGQIRTNIIAYVNFLQGKERAGIERAVMSKTFAADRFDGVAKRIFGTLVTEQDTYFSNFRQLAGPDQVKFLNTKMAADAVTEVQRMRDVAFREDADFGIDASHWFATITKKINLMKEVDDHLASDLQALSKRKAGSLVTLLTLSTDISSLVHEAQKERGLTAAYYGSGRKKFEAELAQQRKLTDTKKQLFEERVSQLDRNSLKKEFVSTLDGAVAKLHEMNSIRSQVSSGSIPAKEAIGFYTGHNSQMLKTVSEVAGATDDGEIRTSIFAYVNLLQGKERAGIERAVMAKTFVADRFEAGTLQKFGTLVNEQDTYFDSFRGLASPEQVAFYDKKLSGAAIDEVQRMRDVAFKMGSIDLDGFGVEASHWFTSMTQKINLMKEVENRLSADLTSNVTSLRASARWTLILLGTVATLVILGVLALVWTITQNIVGALNQSVDFAEKIAGGDLTNQLKSTRKDEIGKLMGALSTMGGNLREIVQNLGENASTLANSSKDLSDTSAQLTSGAEETTNQSTSVASAAEEMSTNMTNMAGSTEQMTASVKTVASAVEEMTASISEIARNAEQASTVAGSASRLAETSNDSIQHLGTAANEIGQVIETIQDIAEQTNLLALNATIEAARAGDAGKGFAVVASEVKELAKQTAEATEDIRQRIEGIQGSTGEAVDSVRQISDVIGQVNDVSKTIASAVEEQSITTKEIARNISQTSDAAQTVAVGVAESATATQEITENITHVDSNARKTATNAQRTEESGQELNKLAGELRTTLGKFTIEAS